MVIKNSEFSRTLVAKRCSMLTVARTATAFIGSMNSSFLTLPTFKPAMATSAPGLRPPAFSNST